MVMIIVPKERRDRKGEIQRCRELKEESIPTGNRTWIEGWLDTF